MTEPVAWVPAFPGQREPFTQGNEMAVTHGFKSPRAVDPIAEQYLTSLLADPSVGYLNEPRYGPQLVAWAKSEARLALCERSPGQRLCLSRVMKYRPRRHVRRQPPQPVTGTFLGGQWSPLSPTPHS
jgi:hypothetical protein